MSLWRIPNAVRHIMIGINQPDGCVGVGIASPNNLSNPLCENNARSYCISKHLASLPFFYDDDQGCSQPWIVACLSKSSASILDSLLLAFFLDTFGDSLQFIRIIFIVSPACWTVEEKEKASNGRSERNLSTF